MRFSRNPVVISFLVLGVCFLILTIVDAYISIGVALQHLFLPYTLSLMSVVGSGTAAFFTKAIVGVQIAVIVFGFLVSRSSKTGWRITWSIPGVVLVMLYMAYISFAYLAPPERFG